MRSPQLFVEEFGPKSGNRLFSFYVLLLGWYVFGIFLSDIIGIEPLYGQVTPFYAQFYPASKIGGVVTAAALLALVVYAAVRAAAGNPISRRIAFLSVVAFVAAIVLIQIGGALRRGVTALDFWDDFKWHLPAIAVVTIASLIAIRFFRRTRWWDNELAPKTAWRMVFALAVFSFMLAGSVAMIRHGAEGIASAYSRTQYEYVDDIGKGLTLPGFLRDYNKLHPLLSMHAKVHPPGPVVILWVMSSILLTRDPLMLSLGTMAVGSLGVLPLFAWVRDMIGQRAALTCCGLYALMPSIVLFTATSADILFMPLVIVTLLLFWRAVHRGSFAYAAGAGVMYAVLSLCNFSLLTLGAFFAFVGLWRFADPAGRGAVLKTAATMLIAFLAFHALFRALTGFDVVECFHLSRNQFVEDQINVDKTQPRYPAWAFKFLNPLCWMFFAGIPTTCLFFWRLLKPDRAVKGLFITFGLTLLVLAPLYLARGEGERSAMYILPFVVIPAAHVLDELGKSARSFQPMAATFLFLACQSWLIESFLYTYW